MAGEQPAIIDRALFDASPGQAERTGDQSQGVTDEVMIPVPCGVEGLRHGPAVDPAGDDRDGDRGGHEADEGHPATTVSSGTDGLTACVSYLYTGGSGGPAHSYSGAMAEPLSPQVGWGVLHLFCKPSPARRRRGRRRRGEGGRGGRRPGRPGRRPRPQGRSRLHGPRRRPVAPAPLPDRPARPPGSRSSTPTSRSPRSASTPRACPRT